MCRRIAIKSLLLYLMIFLGQPSPNRFWASNNKTATIQLKQATNAIKFLFKNKKHHDEPSELEPKA